MIKACLKILIFNAVLCVLSSGTASAAGPQWTLYGSTDKFDAFYDRASPSRTSEGPVLVLIKFVNNYNGAIEEAKQMGINTPVSYSLHLQAFDCQTQAFRLIRSEHYASDNSLLKTHDYDARYSTLNKGSIGWTLLSTLCSNYKNLPLLTPNNPDNKINKKQKTKIDETDITNKYK